MIKTIIFDLAEVILQGLIGVDKQISLVTKVDEEKVKKHLRGEKLIELFKGNISEKEYWEQVIKEGNYDLPQEFFMDLVRKNFSKEIPGTKEILEKLKIKNHKLVLLSDHTKEWIEYIESNFHFLGLFDYRCYSFDSNETKLSPKSFIYTLEKVNADPETTLFIDDSLKNLEVAKSAGIRYVCHFTDSNKLKEDLKNFGIDIED